MIKAALVKKHPKGEVGKYDWSATYRYKLQSEEREYHAYFKEPTRPPVYLYLYYLDNPRKLFRWRNTIMRIIKRSFCCLSFFSLDFGINCDVPVKHSATDKLS